MIAALNIIQSEMDDLYNENSLHWKVYAMDKLGTCNLDLATKSLSSWNFCSVYAN